MAATIIPVEPNVELYVSRWAAFHQNAPAPDRISRLRRAAIERFSQLGFPTTRQEDWKYTNVAPIARTAFRPAPEAKLDELPVAAPEGRRLVFVNGAYAPELSSAKDLRIGRLAERLDDDRLARYAAFDEHAFVALNTAYLADGAYIEIPNGTVLEEPVVVFHITVAGDYPVVNHPRTLIVAGRDSQASVVEVYAGVGSGAYLSNAVTELVAAEGAVVDHYKVQEENANAYHIGLVRTEQGRSSTVSTHSFSLGGALVRNELNAVLAGEGADATLNGLFLVNHGQHADNHTTIDHAMPRCTSHELYKGILDGKSEGVFHGRIIVRKDAQKTDAIQRNRNLLLSTDAVINTKPQLEIYADDVKCTHGATVGQVDESAVFYLQSRGIGREDARRILTHAFAGEILDRVKIPALRAQLEDRLFSLLSR